MKKQYIKPIVEVAETEMAAVIMNNLSLAAEGKADGSAALGRDRNDVTWDEEEDLW